jgi:DNA-binding MarR family transcriptional regulator
MQQYNVLRILKGQQGKPMTVLAITERMLDRMSNASRLVDKLLEKQLVERRQCPNDRRAVDILILPAGLALLARMETDLNELGRKIEKMGNDNLVSLNVLLDQFRTSIF